MKLLTIAAGVIATLSLVAAQTRTATGTIATTGTARASVTSIISSSTAPTGEACAILSSQLAKQSGSRELIVAASLANECSRSAPINQADALRLIDGIVAALNFQSDIGHLKNPPAGYLLAGVDLFGEIADLRSKVKSGAFTSEIDFQRNFSAIVGKAQDGHLTFNFDGLAVFYYQRLTGGLVSVSLDGTSKPEIYLYDDLISYQEGSGSAPSTVTSINGQNATDFLQQQGQNVTYGSLQDPDALYNQMFYQLNSGSPGVDSAGSFVLNQVYPGDNTTITFANGTTTTESNVAIFAGDTFEGLEDGASFYNLYCNATLKAQAQGYSLNNEPGSGTKYTVNRMEKDKMIRQRHQEKRQLKRQITSATSTVSKVSSTVGSVQQTATQIPGYPSPIALSDDLSLSGYFLEGEGFEDTAVLALTQMSEADPAGFQATLTTFLDACRSQKKTKLVIDTQGNPGGTISLGYEVFKQLFPNLYPYGAGTLRAHEGLNTLGAFYTKFEDQLAKDHPGNFTLLAETNYYSQYTATSYTNSSGQLFTSWQELYGPVKAGSDNSTNLIRWDLNDTDFNLATGNIVISGYGNNTEIEPSPFTSDNIILLSDGRCSSTCTILAHFLKYQGKVKSVAMGGRPSTGAMQAIGGIKGSQVYQYALLASDVDSAYQNAKANHGYSANAQAIANSSILGPILNDSDYIIFRGGNGGNGAASLTDFEFNWQNNIAEGDSSYTPLQYVYEAADCRLWFQPSHIYDISNQWATVAAQAFGLNGTKVFSGCVSGSTNASSSLSGNTTLFNNGSPNNVTTFVPEQDGSGSGSGSGNTAGRFSVSFIAAFLAIAAAVFAV